ncbi:hypothetical protein ACLOJK_021669 [Asimina triloba]
MVGLGSLPDVKCPFQVDLHNRPMAALDSACAGIVSVQGLPAYNLRQGLVEPLKIFRWCCPGEEVRRHVSKYIHKWKNLEQLFMKIRPSCFVEIISEISHNCKNFTGLTARSYITDSDAKAIVEFLPKIKYLDLSNSFVSKDILPIILDGCEELEEFYVRNCTAFEVDDEILKKASRLKVFKYDGSETCVDHFSRLFVHVREQIAIILSNYLTDDSSDDDSGKAFPRVILELLGQDGSTLFGNAQKRMTSEVYQAPLTKHAYNNVGRVSIIDGVNLVSAKVFHASNDESYGLTVHNGRIIVNCYVT